MAQSTLGKKMNCSPERGVGPSIETSPAKSVLYWFTANWLLAALLAPNSLLESVPMVEAAVQGNTKLPGVSAAEHDGCAKNAGALEATAVPGKFRSYQSN